MLGTGYFITGFLSLHLVSTKLELTCQSVTEEIPTNDTRAELSKRTLVLGIATTYRWPDLANFVVSLRNTGFSGDITLLVEDKWLQEDDRARFQQYGVNAAPVFSILSRVPAAVRRYRFSRAALSLHRGTNHLLSRLAPGRTFSHHWYNLAQTWFHPVMSARFFIYRNLLRQIGGNYSHIILSDVRDVVFQSNPDKWQSGAGLNYFLESTRATIAAEPSNSRWIRLMYGESVSSRLASARVTCAGVVHGTRTGMNEYLRQMGSELVRQTATIAGENGFDQGVHNYLLHNGLVPNACGWENGAGLAFNMQGLKDNEWEMTKDGTVSTPSGHIVPMIHQYDRHPSLKQRITEKLRA